MYTLPFTLPQIAQLLSLYLRSHQLPCPSPVELHAWITCIFDVSPDELRSAARYGLDSFGVHKAAAVTVKNALEREVRTQQSWAVPVKFGEVIVASGETVQEKHRAGVPAALSLGVVGFAKNIPLPARKTYAEVATSPPPPGFSSPPATTKAKYSSPPPSTPATPWRSCTPVRKPSPSTNTSAELSPLALRDWYVINRCSVDVPLKQPGLSGEGKTAYPSAMPCRRRARVVSPLRVWRSRGKEND
ncbi:hypothetical protein BDD12DRAFT_901372 [Trichophaea hybrida]|nr:hypothetical protein BDD12DRAFT_901372 [Trichophaea hybrida]